MPTIDCVCPPLRALEDGTVRESNVRHPDGDEITFRDKLDFVQATAVRNGFRIERERRQGQVPLAEIMAILTAGYIRYGIESWTLEQDAQDAKGKWIVEPIPVTPDTVEEYILSRFDVAAVLGDVADELYGEQVMLPLLATAQRSSQRGPIDSSTSAKNSSSTLPRKQSSRSSITTTRTAGTGKTSR